CFTHCFLQIIVHDLFAYKFWATQMRRPKTFSSIYEHPVVLPQVSHFRQVPLRTMVKFEHSGQASPT
ncbi:MAG: hypothetical protein ACK4ZN_15475, partial [Oceanibaculum sp.]